MSEKGSSPPDNSSKIPASTKDTDSMTSEAKGSKPLSIEEMQVERAMAEAMRGKTVPEGKTGSPKPPMTDEELEKFVREHPISGGESWIVLNQSEVNNIRNKEVQRILMVLDITPFEMLTREMLTERGKQLLDMVLAGKINPRQAEPFLERIGKKIQEVEAASIKGGGTPSAQNELLENIKTMRIATQQIADASRKSADSTAGGVRERTTQEIANDPLGTIGWLRKKLSVLEASVTPFNSPENQQAIQEINSATSVFPEDVKQEYLARRALHDFYLTFKTSPSIEMTRNASGDITMTNFKTLMRVPGVADAIRDLEAKARRERYTYTLIKEGHRTDPVQRGEKLVTATGDEVDEARRAVREKIKPTIKEALLRENYTEENINKVLESYAEAAEHIGETIWHITGRSGYWNAFTYAGAPRSSGETYEDWQKGFKSASGKGGLSGPVPFPNIFNLREAVKRNVEKGILGYWFKDKEFDPKSQEKIFNPQAGDFWTAVIGRYVKEDDGELKDQEKREIKEFGLSLGVIKTLSKDEVSFLASLTSLPLSEMNYSALPEGQYSAYLTGLNNVDKLRESLTDTNGFLANPTPDNFARLAPLLKHLNEDKQDEIKEALLIGMVDLNRKRGLDRRSLLQKEYEKGKEPWSKEQAEEHVIKLVEAQLVKRSVANRALSKFYGGQITRRAKTAGGSLAGGTAKWFIQSLVDMWK